MGLTHLHQCHLLRDVPAATAANHELDGCRWCHRPFRSVRGSTGRSSLTAHAAQCARNPRKRFAREAAAAAVRRETAAAAAGGSSAAGGAVRGGSTAASAVRGAAAAAATGLTNGVAASAPVGGGPGGQGGEADRLFSSSFSAWTRRREGFLRRVAPTPDDWAPLVASGARTAAHGVGGGVVGPDGGRVGVGRAGAWAAPRLAVAAPPALPPPPRPRRRPHRRLPPPPPGVWRPAARGAAVADRRGGRRAVAPNLRATSAQRRALRQVAAGRLSTAARSLVAEEAAPQTGAAWAKACALFPPATPALATRASVQAASPSELAEAAAFGARRGAPPGVTRDGVSAVEREAPRGKAPGPSGLRVEHLRALGAAGRDALGGVLVLFAGPAGASRVPSGAARALAGTDLLLLRKPGGVQADGLPRLRPIGMPEVLRKLAATALARAVRWAAAALFAPLQLGVGVSSACERILHEVRAHLAAHPAHALV